MRQLVFRAGLAVPLVFGVMMASQPDARAGYYDFTYTVTENLSFGTNYSGVFDVSGTSVIGITGSSSRYGAITGLLAQGSPSYNQFSTTAPYLTFEGIVFTVASGGDASIFYNGSSYGEQANNGVTGSLGTFTVSPATTPAPEAMSLAVLGVGLLGLGVVRSRRREAGRDAARAA